MSKEVQVIAWCDGKHDEGQVLANLERIVTLDGSKPIVLDLCAVHNRVVEDLADLMEYGTFAEKQMAGPAAQPERHLCLICGFVSKSRGGLGHHTKSQHGITATQMDKNAPRNSDHTLAAL